MESKVLYCSLLFILLSCHFAIKLDHYVYKKNINNILSSDYSDEQ